MRISIKTQNGRMEVDLTAFFPDSMARVRRLFRLISAGCGSQEQEQVREWLVLHGQLAAEVHRKEEQKAARLQQELEELETRMAQMKQQHSDIKRRLRGAAAVSGTAARVVKMTPDWVREFDRICGGRGQ